MHRFLALTLPLPNTVRWDAEGVGPTGGPGRSHRGRWTLPVIVILGRSSSSNHHLIMGTGGGHRCRIQSGRGRLREAGQMSGHPLEVM